MPTSGNIQYLRQHEIDRTRWDACIDNADNGLIYGYSFYLDAMCDNWDALILDDYKAVMPLPWRRKYFIYYLYQPYFVNTLGVFGNIVSKEIVGQFLNAIPAKFLYWDLDLNERNKVCNYNNHQHLELRQRKNIFLKLDTYDKLYQGYSRLAKRKLAKAKEEGIIITKGVSANDVIDHYINEYEKKNRIIPDSVYTNLKKTINNFSKNNSQTYMAHTKSNEVLGFYLLYTDKRFVYSILGGSTEKGKSIGAFYALTDAAIQNVAGSQKIFRFEGSDLPGIAFFDLQFGSYPIEYLHIRRNSLPKPIRWLKK
ncbi:hypothetical protein [Flavisolibacter tropicus]|uniref:BioF2-like acetyltransferase domain-containing protein n=1 Tax=Flavisolibacter tropicus TaxID=1492898 RepID=A0A172U116_9BACT|nr:hypothetical protein [Flavisolibacter tropicus]ANE52814.1 hypothetical protein SY85_22395 [Flavisolibacter tropicus]